jgi:uroporphyrinogen-III synthase
MKRVLVTRSRSQAASFAAALRQAGFEPIFLPVIEIRPMDDYTALDRALEKLACYDWVIFTSVNAVQVVWERLERLQIASWPSNVRLAAIGPKTAEALQARQVSPTYVPEEYVAEALLPGLGDLESRWVLLPRAEIARQALPQAIAQAGGIAHEIAVYRTLPPQPDPQGLKALRQGVDILTFTSPSTVHNFIAMAKQAGLDPLHLPGSPRVACIGPITAEAARQEGLRVDFVARQYTTAGLVQELRPLAISE